jgi:uncharacterized membrane protein YkvA (DUF1232 family)
MTATNILIALGALLYVVCPFDFDFVPVLGWVDDAAVAYIAWRHIATPATKGAGGAVIDGEFTVRNGS